MTDPGELADFSALFDRHARELHRYLWRRVGRDRADDLTAETFLVAIRAREQYDPERAEARSWLYGIAHNVLRGHRRAEERQLRAYARTGTDPVQPADTDAAIARVDAIGQGPRLAAALAALRPDDRDVLLMVAWVGLTYEEIARSLGVPVGTVRSRLHRTRAKLARQLGPDALTPVPLTVTDPSDLALGGTR